MLLEALVGCAGVTLRAVATAMGVTIRGGRVVAEGVWDARGTLGVDRAAPVGLTEVTVTFDVDCDADQAKLGPVDLARQVVIRPNGEEISFEIDPFRKHLLLNGLDDIGQTLQHERQIGDFVQ